jgi:hypothetical protein
MCEKKKYDCRKRNYKLVRRLAYQFTGMIGANVRFFYFKKENLTYYDFEPAELNQHIETTLEIFKP